MASFLKSTATRRRRVRALVFGIVAVAVLTAMYFDGIGVGAAASARPKSVSRARAAATSSPQALEADYAILNDSSSEATTPLSASDSSRLTSYESEMGLSLELSAARMAQGPGGASLWLIPGTNGECVIEDVNGSFAGSACGNQIPSRGFIGWYQNTPDGSAVVGFVPNGNSTVAFQTTDGSPSTVAVGDNAVFASSGASDTFTSMQLTNASGVSVQIPLQSSVPAVAASKRHPAARRHRHH